MCSPDGCRRWKRPSPTSVPPIPMPRTRRSKRRYISRARLASRVWASCCSWSIFNGARSRNWPRFPRSNTPPSPRPAPCINSPRRAARWWENANAQLLDVVGRLERRINELESGQKFLPEIAKAGPVASFTGNSHQPVDLLSEGQKHLDEGAAQKALECFDKFLTVHPGRAEAMVKRAAALEKLGREGEALECYNRAIAVDDSLVVAHTAQGRAFEPAAPL